MSQSEVWWIATAAFTVGGVAGSLFYSRIWLWLNPPRGVRLLSFVQQTEFSDAWLQEFCVILNGKEQSLVVVDSEFGDAVKNSLPREALAFGVRRQPDGVYSCERLVLCR